MGLATSDGGNLGDLRALLSQVHPVFMLPPVASSLFGATLAGRFDVTVALLHVVSVFFALYTAHVKDGYIDYYGRGEDDTHPLTEQGCRFALAGASVAFFACLVAIGSLVGPIAAAVTLPGWLIGFNHAPRLDMHPLSATAGYPLGIAFALVGGYYVQVQAVSTTVLGLAAIFLLTLSGIKVIDDAQDYEYDRSIEKRTVAVVVGPQAAYDAAYALMATGMVAVVALAVSVDGIPDSAVAAPVVFGVVAVLASRVGPDLATKLLIRGSYLFLAVLVTAVWFRPLA